MQTQSQTSGAHSAGESMGKYIVTYVAILALAALNFVIAYSSADRSTIFVRMLIVALIEAALGLFFFMHLGSEKRGLLWFVVIFTVAVILGMQYGWTDSNRMEVGHAPYSQTDTGAH
jgi:heme/copper-type cytochrome/quinol oxidase subunit 4